MCLTEMVDLNPHFIGENTDAQEIRLPKAPTPAPLTVKVNLQRPPVCHPHCLWSCTHEMLAEVGLAPTKGGWPAYL